MIRILALLLALLAPAAHGQSVQQSGNVTPGHAAYWITNGVIADSGSALNGFLTSLGVVGGPICINSTSPTVNGIGVPYSQLCMQTFTNAAATITLTAYNGATANSINFIINGSVAPANPLWSRIQSSGFFPPFDQVSYVPSQVGRLTSIIMDNPSALAPGASSIAAQNRVGDQVFLAYTDTAALQQAAPTCPTCTTTAGNNTITMTALPSWVKVGYYVYDRTSLTTTGGAVIPAGTTVQSISGNVVTLSANVAAGGTVAAGDMIVFIPVASQTVANPNTYVCMNPVPAWVTAGMTIADATTPAAIAGLTTITGFTGSNCGAGTQVNLSAAIPAAQTVTSGDQLVIAPTGGAATAGVYSVVAQDSVSVGGGNVGGGSMWGGYFEGRYANGAGGQTIELDSENLTTLAARLTTPNAPFGTGFFTGQPWVPTMHIANVGSQLLNGVFAPQTVSSAIDIISLQDSNASCSPCYGFNHAIVLGLHAIQSIGGNQEAFALASNQQMTWYDSTGVTSIASGTYNNGTGAISLTMNASVSYTVGESVVLYNLTGTGAFASLNGTYVTVTGTTGTTVNVTAAASLGTSTITGGFVSAGVSRFTNNGTSFTLTGNAPSLSIPSPGALVTEIVTGGFVASANLVLASNACVSGLPYTPSGGSCGGGSGTSDQVQIWTGGGGQEATFTTDGSGHPRIGFGTETNPKNAFVVSQNATTGSTISSGLLFLLLSADGASANMNNIANTNGGAFLAAYNLDANCGTLGIPASCPASQEIGRFTYQAYHTSPSGGFSNLARISGWTSSSYAGGANVDHSGFLQITATNTGATSLTQVMQIGPGGVMLGLNVTDPLVGNLVMGAADTSPDTTSGYGDLTINGTTGGNVAFHVASVAEAKVFADATNGLQLADTNGHPVLLEAGTGSYVAGGTATSTAFKIASTTGAGLTDYIAFFTGSQSERMRILTGGAVLINTTSVITASDQFSVHGQTTIDNKLFLTGLTPGSGTKVLCLNASANEVQTDTSGTICGISAARFKTILGGINSALDGVSGLSTPFWRYREGYQDNGEAIHVGLIADEVARMDPRCGVYEDGTVINYSDRCIEAYLAASVRELKAEIDFLKKRLH